MATYFARTSSFALAACTKEQPSLNEKAQAAPAQQAASAKPVQQEGKQITKDTKIALISEFTSGTHAAQYITGVTKAAKKPEYSYPFLILIMINLKWLRI